MVVIVSIVCFRLHSNSVDLFVQLCDCDCEIEYCLFGGIDVDMNIGDSVWIGGNREKITIKV